MQNMNANSKLFEFVKAMRIAARKFTDRMEFKKDKDFLYKAPALGSLGKLDFCFCFR